MKRALFFVSSILLLCLPALAAAQTTSAQTPPSGKIAVIDTSVFQNAEKGVRELIAVDDQLETEFKSTVDELKKIMDKIQAFEAEFKKLADARMGEPKMSSSLIDKKIEEYEALIKEYEQKEATANKSYDGRKAELQNAVNQKIRKAIEVFGKAKGYAFILDISKINSSFITNIENDVTEEFIEFYNEDYSKRENE